MRIFNYLILVFFSFNLSAADIKIIELNNKSIDQIILENENLSINDSKDLEDSQIDNKDVKDNNLQILNEEVLEQISEIPVLWENIEKEELLFLLKNISQIKSRTLKMELINSLNINQNIPDSFTKEEFNKLIIEVLLMLDNRKKAYDIIQSLQIDDENKYEGFYNIFSINYLLSSFKLSEACSLRNILNDKKDRPDSNFYLKVDIFCLILQEKFDEANLLNSLLIESVEIDNYFQKLYEKILNPDIKIDLDYTNINEKNIFLYSAMHRIGNLPLASKFLEIDPINLSIPIILSSSTNIDLRIKSAHYAFSNNLISEDSLAALYQTVDFSYEELNNPSDFIGSIKDNTEISMAYFYQLINIQLLPITRLNSIINFWDFAKKNRFEKIAYALTLKSLNTISPSDDLAIYGPNIAKAYIYNNDFDRAQKWLLFSENLISEEIDIKELNSAKLLFNLSNIDEDLNFNEILIDNFDEIRQNDNSEIFYLIFMSLGDVKKNDFKILKTINDQRPMPSLYMLNMIRDSAKNDNQIQLLLTILASMDGKKWNDLHPEHFRLILLSLKEYKQGAIYNDILLEILNISKAI